MQNPCGTLERRPVGTHALVTTLTPRRGGRTSDRMMRLWKLGHVNLRVSDEEKARWFYCEVLGLRIAERDPEHGGVFTTMGDNFHSLDFAQHPHPEQAQRPKRDQLGLIHIAFQVESHA